ncbi:MAG: C4-dicarboxylate TRAP transporter substrate-binding protein [Rhodospirillales bacterium]|nr:C4-dicarboxylate TRAP transporter substrate-binding protein [Rhodospirillales bacterium]
MSIFSLAIAAPIIALNAPAKATETINLTAIDGYPPKALWVKHFINFYIPEIDRRLAKTGNYKIKWNQAWGGQIVKPRHVLEGLQKGLGDIGVVTTVFHADKVPLQLIAFSTPFVTTDPALVSVTVDNLVKQFPAYKDAWSKFNQVYLTNLTVLDTYQIFSKKSVASIGDFSGLKVAGAGLNLRYLQGTGAAGVGGSLVSFYNKLKTGVVDATMLWPEAVVQFKIVEVAPYMLDARIGAMNSKAITMNADTWKKMPAEVQKAISEGAIAYRDHVSKVVTDVAPGYYKEYEKKGGKIIKMSTTERERWAKTMPNVAKDWADSLEKKGVPGKAILTAYMDAMRKANQPIVRQWDKE